GGAGDRLPGVLALAQGALAAGRAGRRARRRPAGDRLPPSYRQPWLRPAPAAGDWRGARRDPERARPREGRDRGARALARPRDRRRLPGSTRSPEGGADRAQQPHRLPHRHLVRGAGLRRARHAPGERPPAPDRADRAGAPDLSLLRRHAPESRARPRRPQDHRLAPGRRPLARRRARGGRRPLRRGPPARHRSARDRPGALPRGDWGRGVAMTAALRKEEPMLEQLGLFSSASPAADRCLTKERAAADDAWPHRTWRFGPGHSIEYREREATSPAPPAVLGGEWAWNPLVPGWRIDYPVPPFSLDPRGESADRHGPKLLPPRGFLEIDRRRLAGRCPHCGEQSGGR